MSEKPVHVMYVDPNPNNRRLVKRELEYLGYIVHEIENGPELMASVNLASMSGIDLLLANPTGPFLSPTETLDRIREVYQNQFKIVALTGDITNISEHRATKFLGYDGYIPLPIGENFAEQVESYLHN